MFNKIISFTSTRIASTSLLVILAFLLSACNDLVNIEGTKGKAQVDFYISNANTSLKDISGLQASSPKSIEGLEEVNIDVLEIHAHFKSTQTDTAETVISEGEGEWVQIPIIPGRVNLLELNGADADSIVAEAELEEGYYSEVRLILGDENDVVINGETHPLKIPSAQQSGYKIKLGEPLHSGEELNFTIEFDAEKSIHATGNGRYMLKPVWHIFKGKPNDGI